MNQFGQSLFYFFIGEIFSFTIAFLFKEDKTRILVLLLGTGISGYLGFIWQPSIASANVSNFQNTTAEQSNQQPDSEIPPTPTTKVIFVTEPPAPSPQVTIIGGSDVFSYFDSAKALGELAEEQYSLAERNKVDQTLTFTINLNSSRPVIWRWYWCATKKNILNQNMQAINVEFTLNGENISNQFNSRYFPFTEDPMKGWTCFTYEVVLTDWDSGTYYLEQNTTITQPINDGETDFSDGYKIYEYTIYIQ